MRVSELIEQLQKLPQDQQVRALNENHIDKPLSYLALYATDVSYELAHELEIKVHVKIPSVRVGDLLAMLEKEPRHKEVRISGGEVPCLVVCDGSIEEQVLGAVQI